MTVLAALVFGLLAAGRLPVELLPDLAYPSLTVQTTYPDAAPVSVEQFVTRPVEEAVGVIPGVRDLRSVSRAGLSEVILEFGWDTDMDFAALDVREKLGMVELPREAERPRVLRYDPSLDPILRLALSGSRPLDELHELADRWLKPRLEAVDGVAAAKLRGGVEAEVVVEGDEDRLAALGLTLEDLGAALAAENVNTPGGVLEDWGAVYLVRTLNELDTLDAIRGTIVRRGVTSGVEGDGSGDAAPGDVRVEDVADVRRGHRDREEVALLGGQQVVELALHREGSANTLAVAAAVRAALDDVRRELKDDLQLTVLSDQSRYIGAAVDEVWSAALVGGLLAVLVVFFFLRDLPSTLTVALSIPISVIVTFLPLQQAGVSLNIMSLGGLALGVGMLVDNSIVVLEAIDRQRRLLGPSVGRRVAAGRGASEVAGAVTAATLTTLSVFLPIVFVTGVAGQLFYDLAVTVCLSLTASLLVSLTLLPALAGLELSWLRAPSAEGSTDGSAEDGGGGAPTPARLQLGGLALLPLTAPGAGRLRRAGAAALLVPRLPLLALTAALRAGFWGFERLFHGLTLPLAAAVEGLGRAYPPLLKRALARRYLLLLTTVGVFLGSLALIPRLGTDLVPNLSQGEFAFRLRLPEGTPLATTVEVVRRVQAPFMDDPTFARVFAVAGSLPSSGSGRRTQGENLAQVDFVLAPDAASGTEAAAVERVRATLAAFRTAEAELVQPQVLSLSPAVVVNVFADDLGALDEATRTTEAAVAAVPGAEDVGTTTEPGSPEVIVTLDRERAAALGVSAEQLASSVRRQLRGDVVGLFREAEKRLDIRLRAAARYRDRAEDVGRLRLRLADGATVPISAVARVEVSRGPAALHHAGGARTARVTARIGAADLGRALAQVETALSTLTLPPGATVELGGQDQELEGSFDSLRLALALAVFLVFVVMAVQFESLRHPFVILLSVPLGAVGVLGALALTGTAVSVLVLIGGVMLAGVVVNNAIVLVDAVERRRRAGEDHDAALVGGGRERLRPILMTTATTVLALLPMAVGLGAGNELRRPLAVTVIGGLSGATVLTLIVIPCLHRVLAGGAPPLEEAPAAGAGPDPNGDDGGVGGGSATPRADAGPGPRAARDLGGADALDDVDDLESAADLEDAIEALEANARRDAIDLELPRPSPPGSADDGDEPTSGAPRAGSPPA